jgi:hypothetical protein
MAELIAANFPGYRDARIADVAGGKGHLQAALRQRGFRQIVSFDKRKSYAGGRAIYRYVWFDWRTKEPFDLIVGMHPDEGTDHIVLYGREHAVPWCVCPCCVRPSGAAYGAGANDYWRWLGHLRQLGGGPRSVHTTSLPMLGRAVVLLTGVASPAQWQPGIGQTDEPNP